jgi:hypothetical protein
MMSNRSRPRPASIVSSADATFVSHDTTKSRARTRAKVRRKSGSSSTMRRCGATMPAQAARNEPHDGMIVVAADVHEVARRSLRERTIPRSRRVHDRRSGVVPTHFCCAAIPLRERLHDSWVCPPSVQHRTRSRSVNALSHTEHTSTTLPQRRQLISSEGSGQVGSMLDQRHATPVRSAFRSRRCSCARSAGPGFLERARQRRRYPPSVTFRFGP